MPSASCYPPRRCGYLAYWPGIRIGVFGAEAWVPPVAAMQLNLVALLQPQGVTK